MADVAVRMLGVEAAEAYLARLHGGVSAATRTVVRVGTATIYAWGVVFGRTRSGRLARAAGGTFSLPSAFEGIKPTIGPALAAALPQGPQAVDRTLLRLGYQVQAATQADEAVDTGHLRRSYHTVASPR